MLLLLLHLLLLMALLLLLHGGEKGAPQLAQHGGGAARIVYAAIIAISAPLETRGSSDKTGQAVARRMRVCWVRACEGGAPTGRSARAACRTGRAGSRLASAAVSWTKQIRPRQHLRSPGVDAT